LKKYKQKKLAADRKEERMRKAEEKEAVR